MVADHPLSPEPMIIAATAAMPQTSLALLRRCTILLRQYVLGSLPERGTQAHGRPDAFCFIFFNLPVNSTIFHAAEIVLMGRLRGAVDTASRWSVTRGRHNSL